MRTIRPVTLGTLLLLAAFILPPASAHEVELDGQRLATTGTHDRLISRPTRTVDAATLTPLTGDASDGSPEIGRSSVAGGLEDAAIAGSAVDAAALAATIERSFPGLSYPDSAGARWTWGDAGVAVGQNHVLQFDGPRVRITDRQGNQKALFSTAELFGLTDPDVVPTEVHPELEVVFDSNQGRWLILQTSHDCERPGDIVYGRGYVDLAVSTSADPTGLWHTMSIGAADMAPLYISLGTSSDKVALYGDWAPLEDGYGATLSCGRLAPRGPMVFALDWAQLVRWDETIYFTPFASSQILPGGTLEGQFTAVVQEPATSPTLHFAGIWSFAPDSHIVHTTLTGGVVAGTAAMTPVNDLTDSGVDPMPDPPVAEVPGGIDAINMTGGVVDAKWQAGRLLVAANRGCGVRDTDSWRVCGRVLELATGGATPSKTQDFVIDEVGASNFHPSIAITGRGDVAVTWYRSSTEADGYPSVLNAYQRRSDPPGGLSDVRVISTGAGIPVSSNLYVATTTAPDPQVPHASWSGATYPIGGWWGMASRVVQLGYHPGATYVPITPLRVLDSRSAVGVSGSFAANTPREFTVAGFTGPGGSIPAEAIAVTGNVTVVGQTAAGYVAVGPTRTASPRSSTINFPTGDVRANNTTVSLSTAGKLAAVYKAVAGKTTHVLFDVTGYFLPGPEDAAYNTLAPTRFLDSRAGKAIGLSGRFATGVPRKLDIAGERGVPADAVAITANLTVVGQTKGGYVSVTPTSQANPTTSSINFPTGDVRANGLTAKLGGGDVWLVYKGNGGVGLTDLILDVTGYYRPAGAGLVFYPLEPGRIMDTRATILTGLKGTFGANTPRKLDTDGHWGVPAGAKAVTGNLTVTAQTGAGYVSITPTSQADPTTSTLNFPLGDTRANGVTVPLHTDGNQYLVYKASAGRKTHLILDVTGYFR